MIKDLRGRESQGPHGSTAEASWILSASLDSKLAEVFPAYRLLGLPCGGRQLGAGITKDTGTIVRDFGVREITSAPPDTQTARPGRRPRRLTLPRDAKAEHAGDV